MRALRESQVRASLVVLDLRELASMDSSGVHAIVNASTRAQQLGVRLVLQRGPPHVDRMFALTRSSGDIEICDLHPVKPPTQACRQLPERHSRHSATALRERAYTRHRLTDATIRTSPLSTPRTTAASPAELQRSCHPVASCVRPPRPATVSEASPRTQATSTLQTERTIRHP